MFRVVGVLVSEEEKEFRTLADTVPTLRVGHKVLFYAHSCIHTRGHMSILYSWVVGPHNAPRLSIMFVYNKKRPGVSFTRTNPNPVLD